MEDRRIFYYFLLILTLSKECAGSPLERTDKDGNDPINIQSNVTDHNNNNFGYHSIGNLINERGGLVVLCGDNKDNTCNLHLENKNDELLGMTKKQETTLEKIMPLENKINELISIIKKQETEKIMPLENKINEQETKLEKMVSLENKINELINITKKQETENTDKIVPLENKINELLGINDDIYKILNENSVVIYKACGGNLTATDNLKYFYSHARYGAERYENLASCEWRIVAPPGHQVRLTFLTFELEGTTDCVLDFVVVQEGLAGNGIFRGKFCGDKVPAEIVSTTGALTVRFRTDGSAVYRGFSASYQAVKP